MTKTLSPALQKIIEDYVASAKFETIASREAKAIHLPLYHYTNGIGLKGILENEEIWFTDYRHMNDPSESSHGLETARDVIRMLRVGTPEPVTRFLDELTRISRALPFDFFIASLSKARDDLGQWRSYADNGRGYAIAFSPRVLTQGVGISEEFHKNVFVGSVHYEMDAVTMMYKVPIEEATRIFIDAFQNNQPEFKKPGVASIFIHELAVTTFASHVVWNALTTKYPSYAHEEEVRLFIVGTLDQLIKRISTRLRGSEIVPFIKYELDLKKPGSIVEVVVGPAAQQDAVRGVTALMKTLGYDSSIPIGRSDVPYRAL
jgi:hypothetical protein